MKKILALTIALLLMFCFASLVYAEEEWECASCGATVSGNFCENCGAKRPDNGPWTCPNCGAECLENYNFCDQCGTARPSSTAAESNNGHNNSSTGRVITFRDVPWGLNYTKTMICLSELDVKWKTPSKSSGRKIESQAKLQWANYYAHDCLYSVDTSYSSPSINVAGYDISDITLYFAFTEDEYHNIPQTEEYTSFYMAQYSFKPKDLDAVFKDLTEKLIIVYGAPDKEYNDGGVIHYNHAVWYGDDDTSVELVSDDNWDQILINYIWHGGEQLMENADSILRQAELDEEAQKFGTDDTSGL